MCIYIYIYLSDVSHDVICSNFSVILYQHRNTHFVALGLEWNVCTRDYCYCTEVLKRNRILTRKIHIIYVDLLGAERAYLLFCNRNSTILSIACIENFPSFSQKKTEIIRFSLIFTQEWLTLLVKCRKRIDDDLCIAKFLQNPYNTNIRIELFIASWHIFFSNIR